MKKLGILLVFSLVTTLQAQTPNFDYGHFVMDPDDYVIENNSHPKPVFGDWDDDGDLDLIVGVLNYGYAYFYQNVAGIGAAPEFLHPVILMADGDTLAVTYS